LRDGLTLDRGRLLVPGIGDCAENIGAQAEIAETHRVEFNLSFGLATDMWPDP
jgi:hypothetical protein